MPAQAESLFTVERRGLIERHDPRAGAHRQDVAEVAQGAWLVCGVGWLLAGINSFGAAVAYAFAELLLPVIFGAAAFSFMIGPDAVLATIVRTSWWAG